MLEKYGSVPACLIKSKEKKHFAFAEFASEDQAAFAIKDLNDFKFLGRRLRVSYQLNRESKLRDVYIGNIHPSMFTQRRT